MSKEASSKLPTITLPELEGNRLAGGLEPLQALIQPHLGWIEPGLWVLWSGILSYVFIRHALLPSMKKKGTKEVASKVLLTFTLLLIFGGCPQSQEQKRSEEVATTSEDATAKEKSEENKSAKESKTAQLGKVRSMYRGSPEHTGDFTHQKPIELPLTKRWSYEKINVGIHGASKSSPAIDDERVYVGADNERFYAFDRDKGTLLWTWYSKPNNRGIHGTAAVDEARVYIGDYGGYFSAIDKRTGKLVWEKRIADAIGASPTLIGDTIYVDIETNAPDGHLTALDRRNGKELWYSPALGEQSHATPTIDIAKKRAYLGANLGFFHAFEIEKGKEVWRFKTEGSKRPYGPIMKRRKVPKYHGQVKSTAALVGNKILLSSWDKHVYCLNTDTGEEIWRYKTDDLVMSSPTVDKAEKRVYFGGHDSYLYALDLETGKQVWRYKTDGLVYSSATLVRALGVKGSEKKPTKMILIGSKDQHLHGVRAKDGKGIFKHKVKGFITGVPVTDKGQVFVSTDGGELLCLE